MESMSERIRRLRLYNNMTQQELGEKLGVQRAAINKYERGLVENMKRSTIQEMSQIFGVSPSYLMGWEDNNKPSSDTINLDILSDENKEKIISYYNSLLNEPSNNSYINDIIVPKHLITEKGVNMPMWLEEPTEENLSTAMFVVKQAQQAGNYYSFGGQQNVNEMTDETLLEEANELLQMEDFVNEIENTKIKRKG